MVGPKNGRRVVVIGLAEASPVLVERWIQAGELPTFGKLREQGSSGRLASQVPLVTPQMWGTIVTGQPAGVHGLFDFWQRGADGRFEETNGSWLRARPIWQIASEGGSSSGIVNIPFTFPPDRVRGFVIAGQDAPGAHRSIANPPDLYDAISQKFGRYRLKDVFAGGREKADFLDLFPEDVRRQTDVLEYLISEHPTDFFMTFFSASAIAQHYFWADMASEDPANPYRDVILQTYRALDQAIARLARAAGPDASIYVVSECGAGPLLSGVQINTWLAQAGYLRQRAPASPAGGDDAAALRRGRNLVARFRTQIQGKLPKGMHTFANRHLGWLKRAIQAYLADSNIDWSRTRVFARGKEGSLFVNLKGRDPHGIVEPGDEHEALLCEVTERLLALEDPATGQKAISRVLRASEIYAGPRVALAPDLTIQWRDFAYMPTESDRDRDAVFVPRWREYMTWPTSGSHRLHGCFFAQGPGIRAGGEVANAGLTDLLPTWLAELGQPIPADLPGRVIREIFEDTHSE